MPVLGPRVRAARGDHLGADPFAREREAYAAIVSCRADRETGDAAAFLLRNGGTALATQVEAACATTSTDAILGARGPTPR